MQAIGEFDSVQQALSVLRLGAPHAHRNLALFPLIAESRIGSADSAGYLLLDEALKRKLARVTEVSAAGSVPELAFENTSSERILLVDGDELVGAKQNRIINLSILVGGGKRIPIPVSCVEQGRWSYRSREFGSAGRSLFAKARAKKMVRVSESMRSTGIHTADQGEVWSDIQDKNILFQAHAPTGAMEDTYTSRRDELGGYTQAFRAEPGQRGAVAAIDGKVIGIELFDSAATFAKYLDKLVLGYALDALETANGKCLAPAAVEVERFLERIRSAAAERFEALGEGEDLRLTGDGVTGAALTTGDRLVHLAGYLTSR
jgi:hypothetical protein